MAALGFALFFLCMAVTLTNGSQPKSWLGRSIVDNITALNQKIFELESTISSIPLTIQAENGEMLLYILDKIANISEMHEANLKVLLSNHSLRVESLEKRVAQCDDVMLLKQNQRDQILLTEELRQQLEDVQSVLTCTGEPPSPQNGRTVHFEREHGSAVLYRCDVHFDEAENSTVRCHLGKWEGRPPLCRFFDASFILRAHSNWFVSNVTCSSEVNNLKVEFSRAPDTGLDASLPSGANVYSRGKSSVLDLSSVARDETPGVYYCGYEKDGARAGISFHLDKEGRFLRLIVASIGGIAELSSGGSDHPSMRWFHEGQRIRSADRRPNLTITDVKVTDAGTYEIKYQKYSIFFKLVVRGCRSTLFGEGCDRECPPCYNGGTCHDLLGVCVCPPGFTGTNCELACGENKFGVNCSESCQGGDCKWQMFCKPYPSGCSCASGYWGYSCISKCSEGTFGADCKQTCRCAEGPCDPYTGACPGGCSPGWTGQSCQIPA